MKGQELKGLVPIELGGESFYLCFDMNALCEIEDKYGDVEKVFEGTIKMSTARYLLWAGLQHSHADRFESQNDVGKVITLHDLKQVTEKLVEALRVATPEPEDNKKK